MNNSYLILFTFMLTVSKRLQLKTTINNMNLQYPYDVLWAEIKDIKEDLTKEDFLEIVKELLDAENYLFFKEMPDSVTNVIGYRAVNKLSSLNKLSKISNIIQEDRDIEHKLENISKIIESNNTIGKSKSKLISEFKIDNTQNEFYIFHYGIAREELVVLCAFTGRGKTSLMLTFAREAIQNNLSVLYISIKDFSESMLKSRLDSAGAFPDFKASCYSNLSVPDLEIEIDEVKPDVVFVDYLGVMDSSTKTDTRRFELENITSNLKRVAQDKQVVLVTGHQLNKDNPFPKAEDLLEAKAGIVSHADLVLGIGGDIQSDFRNVTTIKCRRHKPLPEFIVQVNFDDLTYDFMIKEDKDE